MDLTLDFSTFWRLMGAEECFANRKNAAREEWNKHPEKHEAIIRWLLQRGAYKKRNPFFFIQDFKLPADAQHPTNYSGKALPKEPVFSAKYNGRYGMYTRADIEKFHLELAPN